MVGGHAHDCSGPGRVTLVGQGWIRVGRPARRAARGVSRRVRVLRLPIGSPSRSDSSLAHRQRHSPRIASVSLALDSPLRRSDNITRCDSRAAFGACGDSAIKPPTGNVSATPCGQKGGVEVGPCLRHGRCGKRDAARERVQNQPARIRRSPGTDRRTRNPLAEQASHGRLASRPHREVLRNPLRLLRACAPGRVQQEAKLR
jgi:hypothetical protein